MPKIKIVIKTIILFFIISLMLLKPSTVKAGALDNVSDTLSTSRLSFFGRLHADTPDTDYTAQLQTTDHPSTSTANLFPGDTVLIGDTDTATEYTVDEIIDSDEFTLTNTLASEDDDTDDVVVATRSAVHTISLEANSAITAGSFEVLVKSTSNSDKSKDGLPDQDGFDFNLGVGGSSPSVVCSQTSGSGTPSFSAGTATYYGDTGCTANGGYHCFECSYTGATATDDVISITIGSTNPLINPSPDGSGSPGEADDYIIKVRHKNTAGAIVDNKDASVAVVESVRVTATVDPTITFTISGITADSGSYCGVTRTSSSIDTTAYSVPFGSITLGEFNDAVQQLSCITNGSGGYAVTVIEDDQLSIDGEHGTELADTDCDADTCAYNSNGDWNSENDESGFGYSLENIDANTITFQHTSCGSWCARAFPSDANNHDPVQLISNSSTPSTTEDAYVCYRLAVGSLQTPGDYENQITYVATATF